MRCLLRCASLGLLLAALSLGCIQIELFGAGRSALAETVVYRHGTDAVAVYDANTRKRCNLCACSAGKCRSRSW